MGVLEQRGWGVWGNNFECQQSVPARNGNFKVGLFKLVDGGNYAVRVPVRLGRASVNTIEIVDGLQVGDVVILSDGWDRGEPEELAEQMLRLSRVAHRVVWVNPLKVTPGYAPLARGMAAALPYVDRFVEGHSLDAMERLAAILDEP